MILRNANIIMMKMDRLMHSFYSCQQMHYSVGIDIFTCVGYLQRISTSLCDLCLIIWLYKKISLGLQLMIFILAETCFINI